MAGGRRVHDFRPGQRGELNVPVRALRLPALSLLARTFICHLRPDQEGHHILLLPFCSFLFFIPEARLVGLCLPLGYTCCWTVLS